MGLRLEEDAWPFEWVIEEDGHPVVAVHGTDNEVVGKVRFENTPQGVLITAERFDEAQFGLVTFRLV